MDVCIYLYKLSRQNYRDDDYIVVRFRLGMSIAWVGIDLFSTAFKFSNFLLMQTHSYNISKQKWYEIDNKNWGNWMIRWIRKWHSVLIVEFKHTIKQAVISLTQQNPMYSMVCTDFLRLFCFTFCSFDDSLYFFSFFSFRIQLLALFAFYAVYTCFCIFLWDIYFKWGCMCNASTISHFSFPLRISVSVCMCVFQTNFLNSIFFSISFF